MTHWSLLGRRILAVGPAIAPLARGPLFGAVLEMASVERLIDFAPGGAELVLIDADAADPAVLEAGVAALAAGGAAPPTLLMGERLPAGLVRTLMRLPHADVLEAPFDAEDLLSAIYGLLDAQAADQPPAATHNARCWSVVGAVGGAGATLLSVEIAGMLAARGRKDHAVCLVDLNLADGAAAAYLGAAAAMGLAEFGAAAERMDAALLAAFATPVGRGLDLLAAPRDPAAFDKVSREAVLRVLEIACDTYDWVILDVPRHRRPWTLEALGGSDEVLVVSELTVPALLSARAYCEELEAALPATAPPRVVLNRVAGRLFGPAPSLGEAERALQRKAAGGIASDWEAAAASVNLGGPVSQHRPKSRIVRDVAALVDRLVAESPPRAAAATRAA